MRGSSITQQGHTDPHSAVVGAVTQLAIEDAKRGDGSAWLYLWTVAPDLAAALWDEHCDNIPDGDVVRPVRDKEMDGQGRRRVKRRSQMRRN